MTLYLSIIFVAMIFISLFNCLFYSLGFSALFISLLVIIVTIAQIVIDVILATIFRWCIPRKFVSPDKKVFCATKREARFYELIGIKKWKDKTLDLGNFTGFSKSKLGNVNDINYVERFIVEANYGVLVHLACIIIGFVIVFLCPIQFRWTIGLPVWSINLLLNGMSTFILRYNLPKLHKTKLLLKKFAERCAFGNFRSCNSTKYVL